MNFIIFDLEWNNAYNYKLKRGMNEIIEIGAVKLDENLKVIDTFKQLIKPKLSKKLGSRFKNLTHITIDEINQSGISFENAFDNFSKWCGKGDNLFLSWSTSDLYTLQISKNLKTLFMLILFLNIQMRKSIVCTLLKMPIQVTKSAFQIVLKFLK